MSVFKGLNFADAHEEFSFSTVRLTQIFSNAPDKSALCIHLLFM